jgi:hypothetical protein
MEISRLYEIRNALIANNEVAIRTLTAQEIEEFD